MHQSTYVLFAQIEKEKRQETTLKQRVLITVAYGMTTAHSVDLKSESSDARLPFGFSLSLLSLLSPTLSLHSSCDSKNYSSPFTITVAIISPFPTTTIFKPWLIFYPQAKKSNQSSSKGRLEADFQKLDSKKEN